MNAYRLSDVVYEAPHAWVLKKSETTYEVWYASPTGGSYRKGSYGVQGALELAQLHADQIDIFGRRTQK